MPLGWDFSDIKFYYCDDCKPEILRRLKDGVYMDSFIDTCYCNTWIESLHKPCESKTLCVQGWLSPRNAPDFDKITWKFTNTARRHIIQSISK